MDARLAAWPYNKTEIGYITEVEKNDKGKQLHTVRVGTEKRYIKYRNVLALGNVEYPVGAVVFLLVPANDQSQSFILGMLSDTPANIVGGEIHIGLKSKNPDTYFFNVQKDGTVSIEKGGFMYGWDDTRQAYNYVVDKDGVKSGLYTDDDGNNAWHFDLNNKGKLNITSGSIHLGKISGTRKYHFNVEEDGSMDILDDNANTTFSVTNTGRVQIKGYLQDGAFNTRYPTDATTIDGACVSTGYIKSPNLRGQDDTNLDSYDGQYTNAGMIIGLEKGFLSSKNFNFASNGDCHFRGDISAATGSIGGWTIGSTYLSSTVGAGTAYLSSGKVHVLASSGSTWRQACFNPARDKCYISGMSLYIDDNGGDLNGDSHDSSGTYVKLKSTGIAYHTGGSDYWLSEKGFKFLDHNEDRAIDKLIFDIHDSYISIGNRSSGKWSEFIFLS